MRSENSVVYQFPLRGLPGPDQALNRPNFEDNNRAFFVQGGVLSPHQVKERVIMVEPKTFLVWFGAIFVMCAILCGEALSAQEKQHSLRQQWTPIVSMSEMSWSSRSTSIPNCPGEL
jgi:hypothetical protein